MKRTTKHTYTKYQMGEGWVFDSDKARKRWNEWAVVDEDGIVRWNSNGHVPPTDCLEDFMEAGLIDEHTCRRSRELGRKEDDERWAEVREHMKDHKPSSEEMFEMRAAFGPGTTVVNVLTGEKTKL